MYSLLPTMQIPPIPSADVWLLFPYLAVLLLVMAALGSGLWVIWGEYKKWSDKEDTKRTEEREKQRVWQRESDTIRDMRWQTFVAKMQETEQVENEKIRDQLVQVTGALSNLSDNNKKLADNVQSLSDILTGHIAVDDARFSVLFTEEQLSDIDRVLRSRKGK
jgi:hypothetical protein